MAALFGQFKGTFRVADYREGDDIIITTVVKINSQKKFKEKLANYVNNGIIHKFSIYEAKLDNVPAPLMHAKKTEGRHLCHEYVSMEIKDDAGATHFVTMEMGQREILVQISKNEEDVTKWRLSKFGDKKKAREKCQLKPNLQLDITNIELPESQHAVTFLEFLDIDAESFSIVPRYHLFNNNCQLFVKDAKNQLELMRLSKEIGFSQPGTTDKKVTIEDDSIIEHIENMYQSLYRLEPTEIPEVDMKFLEYLGEMRCRDWTNRKIVEKEMKYLRFKQEVYTYILNWMKLVVQSFEVEKAENSEGEEAVEAQIGAVEQKELVEEVKLDGEGAEEARIGAVEQKELVGGVKSECEESEDARIGAAEKKELVEVVESEGKEAKVQRWSTKQKELEGEVKEEGKEIAPNGSARKKGLFGQMEAEDQGGTSAKQERKAGGENQWRVIFSNLTQERMKDALKSSTASLPNIEAISSFWRQAFDILVFAPEVGCVVFQFDKDGETKNESLCALNAKADMLAALGNVNVNAISLVSVRMGDLSEKAMVKAKAQVQKDLDSLKKVMLEPTKAKLLIAKLVMLQRLQNQNVLLHEKLDEQKYGPSNAAMFTEEQHEVIELAQKAFHSQQPLHLAVTGPPGAGKTLILFEMAREFVRIVDDADAKVAICIRSWHKVLTRQLQRRIDEDPRLRNRVMIRDSVSNEASCNELVLVDESLGFEISIQTFKRSNHGVVLFSSSFTESLRGQLSREHGVEFEWRHLSHSLRATRKLANFVNGFFQNLQYFGEKMKLNVGVTIEGSSPYVFQVLSPWDDGRKFLDATVVKLKALRNSCSDVSSPEGRVLIYVVGHRCLKEEIKAELRTDGIRDNFTFVDDLYNASDSLGAQWPAVAIVIDGIGNTLSFSTRTLGSSLFNSMTRATTSLLFIFHDTEETMKIDGVNSVEGVSLLESDLPMKLNELAFKELATNDMVPAKQIMVRDPSFLLLDDARQNLHPSIAIIRNKAFKVGESKHARLVAYISKRRPYGSEVCQFFAPVRVFRVFENTQKMDEFKKSLEKCRIDQLNYLEQFSKQV